MNVQDKTVLITGASGGIGEKICQKLANAGAKIIALGREEDRLQALINQLPGEHSYLAVDLLSEEGVQKVVELVNQQGGLDVLINNAGVTQFGMLQQQSLAAVSSQVNINLLAPILLTQALLPILKRSESAAIVNMGSTFGSIGYGGFSVYCASKFGLRGFTEALRRELADTDIRMIYLAPRATRTPINDEQVVAMNKQLGNRMDEPEVVAQHLIQALENDRVLHRYIGWPEKLFVVVNSMLPKIVDRALLKQLPVIRRFAQP